MVFLTGKKKNEEMAKLSTLFQDFFKAYKGQNL